MSTGAFSADYLVKPDGTGDFPTIQGALDVAVTGDTVELTDGTFTGPGNRDLRFWMNGITLRSQSDDPERCVLDCEMAGRGILFTGGEDSTAVVRGIKIARGYAPGQVANGGGGGVNCYGSSPSILRCIFAENSADYGGGAISCWASSAPHILDCRFDGNTAMGGGAIFCETASEPHISSCRFNGNGVYQGGALCFWNSSPLVEDSQFTSNWADIGGVGYFWISGAAFLRSTLHDNLASPGGGLDVDYLSHLTLEQVIIAHSPDGGAIRLETSATAILICCNLHGNTGGDWWGPIVSQLG